VSRRLAAALLLVAGLSVGCVAQQLAEVEQAEAAYDRCVEERGEEDDECEALAERKKQAQRRYEGDARMRWGCDPLQEDCPDRR
jgi:hypothetical protein